MKLYEIEYLVYNGLRTAKYVRKVDDNLITNNITYFIRYVYIFSIILHT